MAESLQAIIFVVQNLRQRNSIFRERTFCQQRIRARGLVFTGTRSQICKSSSCQAHRFENETRTKYRGHSELSTRTPSNITSFGSSILTTMGISDYVWPFHRKFTEVPCARESTIAALIGGPMAGASSILLTGRYKHAFYTSVFAGFGILWASFGLCRYNQARAKRLSEQFIEAVKTGEID